MNKAITHFRGPYRWLSNFWPATVTLDGMEFSSVELATRRRKRWTWQ